MKFLDESEKAIRTKPLQGIGLALIAGGILSRLPVVGIVALAVRVTLSVVGPMLFVLGGVKAWEVIQSRRPKISPALRKI
jgi:hypothetical protein